MRARQRESDDYWHKGSLHRGAETVASCLRSADDRGGPEKHTAPHDKPWHVPRGRNIHNSCGWDEYQHLKIWGHGSLLGNGEFVRLGSCSPVIWKTD